MDADIYLLQETHNATEKDEKIWTTEWGGKTFWSRGDNRSRGVAIFINPKFEINIENQKTDRDGRVVSIKAIIEECEYNITSIYAPNGPRRRKDFFNDLGPILTGNTNLLIGGDFNCIAQPELDKLGGDPNSGTAGYKELKEITSTLGLEDIWRKKHNKDKLFTWNKKDFSQRSRIDRWYISTEWTDKAHSNIRACPYSDHSAVEVIITPIHQRRKGKGIWKMNTSILKDKQYEREMRAFLKHWRTRKKEFRNIAEWWDEGKVRVKKITITHCVLKAKKQKRTQQTLLHELTELKSQQRPDNKEVAEIEMRLNKLDTAKAQGVQVRSRATWAEKGERSTKYFFSLEKKKQPKNTIKELITENGTVTTDIDILETAREFYRELYTEEDNLDQDQQNWLVQQLDRILDNNERESCEGPITTKEMDAALKEAKMNKAPGPDGIPAEFYQQFWKELKDDLCDVLNENFENNEMTESQRQAILRLLFKKDNEKQLKNWRPISLLNSDYKLTAKVIATRLKKVLPTVIDEDQTCGVPGRSIYENVFRLRDIIQYNKVKGMDLTLINLDQEKAFDRVNRTFLQKTLKKMNFGPSFRRWIEVLYAGANCFVLNNGWSSDPIHLQRGVRQGCPLSPLLYTIVAETLGTAIRKEPRIEGAAVPGTAKRSKISQYADDATLTLDSEQAIVRSFEIINIFEAATGSKLNMDKTEGIHVGRKAGQTHGPVPIRWQKESIEVLGTKLGNNEQQEWDKKVEQTEKKLERWSSRNLSIEGRAVLIRTYALATIMYLATAFNVPNKIITRINKAIFSFLWKGGTEMVARRTCHMHKDRGGLNIPDIQIAKRTIKVKWIKNITDERNRTTWVHFARYWLGVSLSTVRRDWIWLRSTLKPHGGTEKMPKEYKEIKNTIQEQREEIGKMKAEQINAKNLYRMIQKTSPPAKAEDRWRRTTTKKLEFKNIWKELWHTLANNQEKETLWKLTHRVLPTRCYLAKWGIRTTTKCPFCTGTEDIQHAVVECQRAKQLWQRVESWIMKITGVQGTINMNTIVFSEGVTKDKYQHQLVRYLILTTLDILWNTRNKKVYDQDVEIQDLNKLLDNRIKNRIINDHINNRKSNLELIWSINDLFCTYSNEKVTLKFEL